MADKEMIAATLAAGVLAAAPPVRPVGGRKRGGKPLFGGSRSTRTRSPGSRSLAGGSAPRGFCPRTLFCGTADPRPILGQRFRAAVSECSMRM